jgi:hypothetical protein
MLRSVESDCVRSHAVGLFERWPHLQSQRRTSRHADVDLDISSTTKVGRQLTDAASRGAVMAAFAKSWGRE